PRNVAEQLVEEGNAWVPADAEGMHDEQEAATGPVGALELGLPDLEHLRGRSETRHIGEEAEEEVGRVVQLPAHGQLHEVAQTAADGGYARPVGLVVTEEARAVR